MQILKRSIQLDIVFLLLFGLTTAARPESDSTLSLRGTISGEFRSNINRQPGLEKDDDVRLNLIFNAAKEWQLTSKQKIALLYDLQHYRYGEFSNFTRYDQTLWGQFVQSLGQKYRFTISDEFRFRYHPSSSQFNYTKNIIDLNVNRKVHGSSNLIFGYQNWLKSYHNNSSLSRYISHRASVKFNHEFSRSNLGATIEYQNHKGNLYAGSTAPEQPLNVIGNRLMLRLNFDKVFSLKLVTSASYKYELDLADDFDITDPNGNPSDEESDEFVAEDSDFGYAKHQSSLSVLFRANPKVSFLFFYLFYTKGFDYWRIVPEGPLRQDKVLFFSNKIRFMLSKRFGIDVRHIFESNRTNLNLYKYEIHSISVGLNMVP
jgi:hypothetical protein